MTNPNDSAHGYGFCTADGQSVQNVEGLTKREYFAVMAMQGMLANNSEGNTLWNYDILAKHSLFATDALINALNEES